MTTTTLRDLPSVEQLLQISTAEQLVKKFGRPLTLNAIRFTLDDIRARFKSGPVTAVPLGDLILVQVRSTLIAWTKPTLLSVINASGMILDTNLGRAPFNNATLDAMYLASSG